MPHTVRLPYIELSVANDEAVTVTSRVSGLVTIGPTITLRVAARIGAVDDERLLPQQVRVERPDVPEAPVSAGRARSTTRDAGGLHCRTTPKSMVGSLSVRRSCDEPRSDEPTVPGRAEIRTAVDDHGPAGEHCVDVTVDLVALPCGVVHVHVVGSRPPMLVCPAGS